MSDFEMKNCSMCHATGKRKFTVHLVTITGNKLPGEQELEMECPICCGLGKISDTARNLSPEEQEMVRLEVFKTEVLKDYYEAKNKAMKALIDKYGPSHIFQDPVSGVVYGVAEHKWSSVPMEHYEFQRTKLKDEQKGSMTQKKAEEAGFKVRFPAKLTDDTRSPDAMPYRDSPKKEEAEKIGTIQI